MTLRATFLVPKPQPEHTPEELAKTQQIPVGVTSGSPVHQWKQHSEDWPEVVEIPKEILR